MAAANTDKFRKVKRSFTTTLSAPGISNSATNIPLPSVAVAQLPTDTAVTITIDRVNSSGVATPTLREDTTGVADPGNNRITTAVRTEGQAHNTGAVVEITWTEIVWNDAVDGILLEHDQAGKHKPEKIDAHRYAADAGSNDTYAVTLSPVPAAYVTGMMVNFMPNTKNTGAATLNVNSLGAKTIKKITAAGKADLADNDLVNGTIYQVVYDGTDFQLLSPTYEKGKTDGWVDLPAGTYVSGTTFTIPGDWTGVINKFDKLKMVNSTTKYLFVILTPTFGSGVTTITIGDGIDGATTTLANAAITSLQFSKLPYPNGFPVTSKCPKTWFFNQMSGGVVSIANSEASLASVSVYLPVACDVLVRVTGQHDCNNAAGAMTLRIKKAGSTVKTVSQSCQGVGDRAIVYSSSYSEAALAAGTYTFNATGAVSNDGDFMAGGTIEVWLMPV